MNKLGRLTMRVMHISNGWSVKIEFLTSEPEFGMVLKTIGTGQFLEVLWDTSG